MIEQVPIMIGQGGGFDGMTIVYMLIATIFLWLFLYLSTIWIVSKNFASGKKGLLLLSALLIVLLVPVVTSAIMYVLNFAGEGMASLRNLIDPNNGGSNQVGLLGPVIGFLLFILILHFLVNMNWNHTIWVSLIGIFLLYLVYSAIPELNYSIF